MSRKDAIKVKDIDTLHKIQIRFQPKRCDFLFLVKSYHLMFLNRILKFDYSIK